MPIEVGDKFKCNVNNIRYKVTKKMCFGNMYYNLKPLNGSDDNIERITEMELDIFFKKEQ